MTDPNQFKIVNELVDDAVAHGATLLCGGPIAKEDLPEGLNGNFYAPTVLTGVNHGMRIMKEEIFGPVIPIITVDSEDEAVKTGQRLRVRPGRQRLDRRLGRRPTRSLERLEAGNVWINDHMYSAGMCQCSWGGVEGQRHRPLAQKFGFYESVEIQVIAATHVARGVSMWVYPYGETVGPAIRSTHRPGLRARARLGSQSLKDGAPALGKMTGRIAKNLTK